MASDQGWRWKGTSYLRFQFSINEGYYPNVHIRYNDGIGPKFFYYIALSPRWRWNNGR